MTTVCSQIYLDGEDVYQSNSANVSNKLQATWRDGCQQLHPRWQIQFWDLHKAEDFLQEKASWFLPAFRALPKTVLKGPRCALLINRKQKHCASALMAEVSLVFAEEHSVDMMFNG